LLTEVTEGSPASEAGFNLNDYIVTFGSINY